MKKARFKRSSVRVGVNSPTGRLVLGGAASIPFRRGFARVTGVHREGDVMVVEVEYLRSSPGLTGSGLKH